MTDTEQLRLLIKDAQDKLFMARMQLQGTVGNQSISDSINFAKAGLRRLLSAQQLQKKLNKKWHKGNVLRYI